MTTCPDCRRRYITAAEWDALPDGSLVPGDLCRGDTAADWTCDRLAADLRAKADAELLALARRLVDHLGVAPLVEVADLLDMGDTPEHKGQDADDHLLHAVDHLAAAEGDLDADRPMRPDPSSGRSQFAHGAARCLLGLRCEIEADRGRGGGEK